MSPGSDEIQQGKKEDHSFIQNGFEHFPISPKKTLTVGLLVGIIYFIGSVLSNYKLALSEVDTRIENYKPLNQRLDKLDWKLDALKEKADKQDNQTDQLWKAVNARKK